MFRDLYRKIDAKIEPDLKLVKDTKEKMISELKQRKMTNLGFYKYATVAACFILVVGLCTIKLGTMSSQVTQDLSGNATSSLGASYLDNVKPSKDVEMSNLSGLHSSGMSNNSFSSISSTIDTVGSTSSNSNPIVEFFANILQWFKELLF